MARADVLRDWKCTGGPLLEDWLAMAGSLVDLPTETDLETLLERPLECEPVDTAIQQRHVLVEIGPRAVGGHERGDADHSGKPPRVRVGDAPSLGDELLESTELREAHRSVEL